MSNLDIVASSVSAVGYDGLAMLCDAESFGVPQHRPCYIMFLLATSDKGKKEKEIEREEGERESTPCLLYTSDAADDM
eukprot:6444647-Prorocentrum_lima.AAC.1